MRAGILLLLALVAFAAAERPLTTPEDVERINVFFLCSVCEFSLQNSDLTWTAEINRFSDLTASSIQPFLGAKLGTFFFVFAL